jgi:hypothetical protein
MRENADAEVNPQGAARMPSCGAGDPGRLKFLANDLPFAKSFVKMSEIRQLP